MYASIYIYRCIYILKTQKNKLEIGYNTILRFRSNRHGNYHPDIT